ncbi:hypothetical protein ACFQT0_28295 [Hymenobacter humi]|uniref:Uncharacterized protein n=1 Tax=Hymenobacter humi TaxID=1411620 RepID=A0ABW2UCU1_9BACT
MVFTIPPCFPAFAWLFLRFRCRCLAPRCPPPPADHETPHWLFRYVFSQDPKTIAKQYLLTGMAWALVAGTLSTLFRLQLG